MEKEFATQYRKIFNEHLAPHGFKRQRDVFLRVVNNEIVQIISIYKRASVSFSIEFDWRTIYAPVFNASHFKNFCNFRLETLLWEDGVPDPFGYGEIINVSQEEALLRTILLVEKHIIPLFDGVKSIEDMLQFYKKDYKRADLYSLQCGFDQKDGLALIKARNRDDFSDWIGNVIAFTRWTAQNTFAQFDEREQNMYSDYIEKQEKMVAEVFCNFIVARDTILNNPEILQTADELIEERAKQNTAYLKKIKLIV